MGRDPADDEGAGSVEVDVEVVLVKEFSAEVGPMGIVEVVIVERSEDCEVRRGG